MRLSSVLPTLTATGMAMAAPTEKRQSGDFKGEMLAAHNFFRSQHGADPLTWDDGLANKAQKWAQGCKFQHSNGDSGENLAANSAPGTWGSFVNMWGSERKSYSWDNPGFSSGTGHFTQVVWKATKTVGCGQFSCSGSLGVYVVCNYDPPGNYNNDYPNNVGKQTKGSATDVYEAGKQPDKEPPKEPEQPPKEPEQPPKEPEQPPKEPEEPEDDCENEEGDPEWNQDGDQEGNQEGNQDGDQGWNPDDWNPEGWNPDWNNKDWNHNDWNNKDWSKYWNKE
ncbi:Allergen V5/Tpx-1-related protein [Metarhizium guizhouense ARSEF 977]|uniref:Allergen V5/Tpx-1-related protein n=1 Tax=Metarhizium guizhouense (strain ARSEF 977) TaxID=1276136 RepID=A0A0B4GTV5_METGA|nr:Allergen V5/Tpx-1-related protein [Metarhizium guizhouense ARSEF 977]